MDHKGELLSGYLDGELSPAEKADVRAHLDGCAECAAELESLAVLKRTAAAAPRRALPPELLARLTADASRPTWSERLAAWAPARRLLLPAGAAAAVAAGLLLWDGAGDREEISLEPLLAAHARYCAEGLAPQENLVHPEFIDDLSLGHAD